MIHVGRLSVLLFIASLIGCEKAGPPYPTARLEGSVAIDGDTVKEGRIRFVPKQVGAAPPAAVDIINGHYRADYVPLGKVRVKFSVLRRTDKMNTEYSSPYPVFEEVVAQKYRDGIELEVTGDDLERDFQLESEGGDRG